MIFGKQEAIPVEKLTEALLRKFPVWKFCNDDELGETAIQPVKDLPITSANGCLIACDFRLADGSHLSGLMGNLSLKDDNRNQNFLTISVFIEGKFAHLARYHDSDSSERGPSWLASRLGKNENDVFPISYDISAVAIGKSTCIRGAITKEPIEKLSRAEIIRLAVR
jgi:hypothetical protein